MKNRFDRMLCQYVLFLVLQIHGKQKCTLIPHRVHMTMQKKTTFCTFFFSLNVVLFFSLSTKKIRNFRTLIVVDE